MPRLIQPELLQALGWATLNSFWQAGLLWCGFVVLRRWFVPGARVQFRLAAGSLVTALLSFVGSFLLYQQGWIHLDGPVTLTQLVGTHWFPMVLTAASFAYLLLLAVPAVRLANNWRLLRRLRRSQLTKAPAAYRLYVQKIAGHLGIHRPVRVHRSALVQSPVTIGYRKPLILLPVAGFSQLSLQQAEAILLHEMAHIRRSDFVVNIALNIIHTVLYFNPFVRLFIRVAENSRETCCDEWVLRFGYDPMIYADALVQLEKNSTTGAGLALAATGKHTLLSRVQTIVGIPAAVPALPWRHFTGWLASVAAVLLVHALAINAPAARVRKLAATHTELATPFAIALAAETPPPQSKQPRKKSFVGNLGQQEAHRNTLPPPPVPAPGLPLPAVFIQVAQPEDPMASLQAGEQAQVAQTIAATQHLLATVQWQAMEQEMADALNKQEKAAAHRKYQEDLAAINWKQLAANLASGYHHTNWEALNQYLRTINNQQQLDSLLAACAETPASASKLEQDTKNLLLPDHSEAATRHLRNQLRLWRDSLENMKKRPVIRL